MQKTNRTDTLKGDGKKQMKMNQVEYQEYQREVMQKYANGAVRAIRTGYSEKRYDLKNKL